jgi:hypothetical protein
MRRRKLPATVGVRMVLAATGLVDGSARGAPDPGAHEHTSGAAGFQEQMPRMKMSQPAKCPVTAPETPQYSISCPIPHRYPLT